METKLQKWGNSYGIRIPKVFLKSLNIKENDKIKIEQQNDCIVVTKSNDKKISLKERFKNYKGDYDISEFEWDNPMGREIW